MTSNKNNSKAMSMVINCIWIILLIVLDQITKLFAIAHLKNIDSISLIRGVFELRYLENQGAAWGMFSGARFFFVVFACLLSIVFAYIYFNMPTESKYNWMKLVIVLFISGALGNMIDRVVNGFVVDFFYFSLIDFPVFNVADIYITCGAFLFVILILFYYKDDDFSFLIRRNKKV